MLTNINIGYNYRNIGVQYLVLTKYLFVLRRKVTAEVVLPDCIINRITILQLRHLK